MSDTPPGSPMSWQPPSGSPAGPPAGPPSGESGAETPVPSEPHRQRSKGAIVAAAVAVVALVGTGVFAISRLSGDPSGGAASPVEVGERLLDALDDQDVLGLVDLLLPSEREVFRQPLVDLVDELTRLEVLDDSADLSSVDGFDVEIAERAVTERPTSAPDISSVQLRGEVTVLVDGQALPIGDLIFDTVGPDLEPAELDATSTEPLDLEITTVEHDGRWYLSLFFSIAEGARNAAFDPAPDVPAEGIDPDGGETPEGAIDALLEGVADLDLRRIIAALNPGEAAALQRYAPLFVDDAQEALDEVPLTWRITEAEYRVTGDGDVRDVGIEVLTIEGELDGAPLSVEFADGCWRAEVQGEQVDSCELLAEQPSLDDLLGDSPAVRELVDVVTEAFADYRQPGITVRRTDGEWFVSPIGTGFEQLLAVLRALDRDELDRVIEAVPAAFEELLGGFFGGDPFLDDAFGDDLLDDPFGGDDPSGDDDPSEATIPALDDPGTGDDPGADAPDEDELFDENAALEACFSSPDVDTAVACFNDGIATGEIVDWTVPVEFRYPECGAAAARWDGYFSLDDATFMAVVDLAGPCFVDLVNRGVIETWDVPIGFDRPECFEGRNWYAVFDDPEYDDRFFECTS